MVTETWPSPTVSLSEFFPSGYIIYCKDRPDNHRGVLLAHKDCYHSYKLSFKTECEIIGCQIELSENSLVILAAYTDHLTQGVNTLKTYVK